MPFGTPVFKTGAFNRSATAPIGGHDSMEARRFSRVFLSGIIETFAKVR
jgi:hypothetical protein